MTVAGAHARVSASTASYAVVGHPVAHSLSPAMQGAAFRACGIDACYHAFDVAPDRLAQALAGARALGFRGLNLTVPHKQAALALARSADAGAELVGAANTLVPEGDGWRAHNTDVEGFLKAVWQDLSFAPRGRRCVVLGAGGAARAAVVALARSEAQEIRVLNRNRERAEELVRDLRPRLGTDALSAGVLERAPEQLGPGDLVVSATPVGLDPHGSWPWEMGRAPQGVLVYDMAYRPGGETPLVRQARDAGLRAASGLSMLLWQGALAFRLWTGREAPLEEMEGALRLP